MNNTGGQKPVAILTWILQKEKNQVEKSSHNDWKIHMKIFSSAQQKLAGRKGTYTKLPIANALLQHKNLLFIKSAKTLNQSSYVMCISASIAPLGASKLEPR
jgi:hypothetical protein